MPLPTSGAEWPPRQLNPVNAKINEWSAWYSGDPEQISQVYSGRAPTGLRGIIHRVATYVRRWFWGEVVGTGKPARNRVHYPLAGDIASASAALLFSEPPTFVADIDLDDLLDDSFRAALQEGAEICAALGGVYLRAVWGTDTPTRLTVIHPDAAVPVWRDGELHEVTVWRAIWSDGTRIVRHLEHHSDGLIEHGVYDGTVTDIGTRVALSDYPETAGLPETVDTGLDVLAVAYVPNVRPNRIWRSLPEASALGVSDYSGLEGMLDQLDAAWSSWMRDVDLGRARLIVPRQYLQGHGPGEGASFDVDQEIYEPVSVLGGDQGLDIQLIQPTIRGEEHARVVDALKRDITSSAGYSGRSFGLDSDTGGPATATEVNSLDRKDMITRSRKVRYWAPALDSIVRVLAEVDGTPITDLTIEWPDGVAVDPESQARTLRELHTARAISTEEKVRELHPDWDDEQITAEVQRIRDEDGASTADPEMFGRALAADELPETDEQPPADA
ncbi:phage portal protein [Stackebrandtia soli]|uniref:phage portal protein n=1 Tax=Stackebrandtia soli TaxID=1892856 RepID=UPI0039EA1398